MMDHPYLNEVKYALELFNSKGFKPKGFDDGGDDDTETDDINEVIEGVLSVDDSWVYLQHELGQATLYVVLGNEPGVAICNYNVNKDLMPLIDKITEEIYEHFNQ